MICQLYNTPPFTDGSGCLDIEIKPFTIVTGDNGTCKTKFLQEISKTIPNSCDSIITDDVEKQSLTSNSSWVYDKNWNTQILTKFPGPNFIDFQADLVLFPDVVQFWICHYFKLGSITFDGPKSYRELLINDIPLSNYGFGINHLVNIIINTLAELSSKTSKTLMINNPENYLSTKNQLKITDFLLAQSMLGHNIVVKTNSDHILNRLVHRVMQTHNQKENLFDHYKIYYLSKNSDNSINVNGGIIIDAVEGLKQCPVGFSDQYIKEVEDIISTGFKNLQSN